MLEYNTGAGLNRLDEEVKTRNYYSTNVFANYDETFGGAHHLSGTFGMNYETWASKNISVGAEQLLSVDLDDLNLATRSAPKTPTAAARTNTPCWDSSAVSTTTTRDATSSK